MHNKRTFVGSGGAPARKNLQNHWGYTDGETRVNNENWVTRLNTSVHGNTSRTGFTKSIEGVLEDIMRKSEPNLWDKHLLNIIEKYDDKDNRARIKLYRKVISRLEDRLKLGDDAPTMRMILRKMIRSYERRLDDALDILTSTPASSDDEDADEPSENLFDATYSNLKGSTIAGTETQYNSSIFEGLEIKLGVLRTAAEESSLKERKSVKVNDTINPVETPKNI